MSTRYTTAQIRFLKAGYKAMKIPELTVAFNRKYGLAKTERRIKSALTQRGIRCGRPTGTLRGSYKLLTKEQARFLVTAYKKMSLIKLTAELNKRFGLNCSVQQVRSFTMNHRIRSGRTGQFAPGNKSWNAGTKGQGLTGANRASFKPGNRPHGWKPIGTDRLSKEGYLQRKVSDTGYAPRDWTGVHILLWEEHNGPAPKGHAVIFIDGDNTNIRIENLVLVSRAELLYLNRHGFRDLPAELKPSMLALAKLEAKKFSLLGAGRDNPMTTDTIQQHADRIGITATAFRWRLKHWGEEEARRRPRQGSRPGDKARA